MNDAVSQHSTPSIPFFFIFYSFFEVSSTYIYVYNKQPHPVYTYAYLSRNAFSLGRPRGLVFVEPAMIANLIDGEPLIFALQHSL